MSYEYIPRPELEYDLRDVCEGLSDDAAALLDKIARIIVVRVVAGTMEGEPLTGNLRDCRKVKFDLPASKRYLFPEAQDDPAPRWRLVYRVVNAQRRSGVIQQRLDVLAVGRRGDLAAYRVATRRLRRGR